MDPFCGVGTTSQAAMILGRQGVGLDIDKDCIHSFAALHQAIYNDVVDYRTLNVELMLQSSIGAHFVRLLCLELNAVTRVRTALETRHRDMIEGPLLIEDHLLVATQMRIFRNTGLMFLRFCNDLHNFGSNDFTPAFMQAHMGASLAGKEQDIQKRPNVDSIEGLGQINSECRKHLANTTYRALYLKFHEQGDESYISDDDDSEEDESDEDADLEIPTRTDRESDSRALRELDEMMSPIDHHLLTLASAAAAEGSPRKVRAFEEKMREADDLMSHHSEHPPRFPTQAPDDEPAPERRRKRRDVEGEADGRKKSRS